MDERSYDGVGNGCADLKNTAVKPVTGLYPGFAVWSMICCS